MPFYSYHCKTCKKTFKAFHGADESEKHCIICKSETLDKVLPTLRLAESKTVTGDAKSRVEKFIEESRETLKEQKAEATREMK
jgi:putative FmdB family regulatory protein